MSNNRDAARRFKERTMAKWADALIPKPKLKPALRIFDPNIENISDMIISPPKKKKYKNKTNWKSPFKDKRTASIDEELLIKPKKQKWFAGTYKPSKGEKAIFDFLSANKVVFTCEKQFRDLTNPFTGEKLRMDFYLRDLRICIEFDGRQHFEICKRFDPLDNATKLKYRQTKDKAKNDYCNANGIKMIRIHYKDINRIPEILKSHNLLKNDNTRTNS